MCTAYSTCIMLCCIVCLCVCVLSFVFAYAGGADSRTAATSHAFLSRQIHVRVCMLIFKLSTKKWDRRPLCVQTSERSRRSSSASSRISNYKPPVRAANVWRGQSHCINYAGKIKSARTRSSGFAPQKAAVRAHSVMCAAFMCLLRSLGCVIIWSELTDGS